MSIADFLSLSRSLSVYLETQRNTARLLTLGSTDLDIGLMSA